MIGATNRNATKKAANSRSCTADTCSREARLESILVENKFLGETIDNLQEALEMADQQCHKYRQDIDLLSGTIAELQVQNNQLEQRVEGTRLAEEKLNSALNQCRQLRDDKTQLIEQSWMSLQHTIQIRQRNDQLERQLRTMQQKLEDAELEMRNQEANAIIFQVCLVTKRGNVSILANIYITRERMVMKRTIAKTLIIMKSIPLDSR